MWSWSKRSPAGGGGAENAPSAEHRRAERWQTAVVSCALGPIVDISRTGMSVRVQRNTGLAPGSEIDLELTAPSDAMDVRARVVRVRPIGGGRSEIALEFVGLAADDLVTLENLVRHGKRRLPGMFTNDQHRAKLVEALRLPDYYRVLGLGADATMEQVQRAYRALARQYHPDVCREDGAQQRFCLINEAHETLGEPEKRLAYDALYALRKAA